MNEALDFPLPPTTGPYVAVPPTTPSAVVPALAPAPVLAPVPVSAPAPDVNELTALRDKVAELEHVVSLAKTRVETLGAEKREALERAQHLEAQLDGAQRREADLLERMAAHEPSPSFDDKTVAELMNRVAALEAIVAPSRAA
jgi:hypothetical protein